MTFQDTMKWVEHELKNGRSDTVHDFLAYLAEQMIELNKRKNEEIKGFLKWLEREIGCNIDNLIGKTFLKDYHEGDLIFVLAILKRNRERLSIDPTNRKFQESLEKHLEGSMAILKPLENKIQATDNLIDQIFYRVYNLTSDEVEIVERSGYV